MDTPEPQNPETSIVETAPVKLYTFVLVDTEGNTHHVQNPGNIVQASVPGNGEQTNDAGAV